jgi:hypothetical protein
VATGAYRNRSVSIYKDDAAGWKLRHVGWLGAEPPTITGLKPVEFSAGVDAHEFSSGDDMQVAWALTDISGAFRRLRDWLIGDKGLDVADQVLPDSMPSRPRPRPCSPPPLPHPRRTSP